MDLTGERNIAATRDVVCLALNDPMILKNSMRGAGSAARRRVHRFRARLDGLLDARIRYFGMIARAAIHSS
jgi:carbon monoxide dehydrogenase subunit G